MTDHRSRGFAQSQGFAVWLTGLPASGKSTIARSLKSKLIEHGLEVEVLESDELRKVFTPRPSYDGEERDLFYRQMVYVGALLTRHGIAVIFDATANRRMYRDRARGEIRKFLEVYVECPLDVCMSRDPKGIYRQGLAEGKSVPGLQAVYEAPEAPGVVIRGDRESAEEAAGRVIAKLAELNYL